MSGNVTSETMYLMVGEIRGQLRELSATVNGVQQVIGDVHEKVANLSNTPGQVNGLKAEVTELENRVTRIEATEHQRTGALKLGEALLRALPWSVPAAVFGIAIAFAEKALP